MTVRIGKRDKAALEALARRFGPQLRAAGVELPGIPVAPVDPDGPVILARGPSFLVGTVPTRILLVEQQAAGAPVAFGVCVQYASAGRIDVCNLRAFRPGRPGPAALMAARSLAVRHFARQCASTAADDRYTEACAPEARAALAVLD